MLPAMSIRVPDKNNGETKLMRYFPMGNDVANSACKTIINVIMLGYLSKRINVVLFWECINSHKYNKNQYTIQIQKGGDGMKSFLYTTSRSGAFFLAFACCVFVIEAMDVIE